MRRNRATMIYCCGLGLYAVFIFWIILNLLPNNLRQFPVSKNTSHSSHASSNKKLARPNSNDKVKIILMWSTWSSMFADELLVKARCPVTSCLFTCDVSLLGQSDVVVVYVDTMTDLPLSRYPHQRFVFYQLESPVYTNEHLLVFSDERLRYDYFNWTMSYRRDSDIILRDYYGAIAPKTAGSKRSPWMDKSHQIPIADLIKKKTKMVTWFVAHCSTPIRREEYARQLGQYVAVDIFGRCSGQDCPYPCDEMLRADYKFYLAFENSWCPDYVTEKFYRALVFDAVPIVLGGANYSWLAPPHSYINARDYKSPKELADYLKLLDSDDALYARYFDWKKDYDVNIPDMSGWCDLCRMAHDDSLPPKVYHDIEKWWMLDGGECETNSTNYF